MNADDAQQDLTDTIVLIHGLWLTALSWEHWIGRYRARGYRVLAPNWPGLDAAIEELRRKPSSMARLGVTEIADHYDHLVRDLGHPPVIVGHSVGGLAAQILLDRGLGAAGVSIDPAPALGTMRRRMPLLTAGLSALRQLRNGRGAIPLTTRQFHRVLANTLSQQQAIEVFERYYVPGPARIIRQVSFGAATSVDFSNGQRAPLLLIAGGRDRIFPVTVTRSSFERYQPSKAVTAYREFPERSNFTIGEPGWERVADYTLRWAMENARTQT